MVGGGWFKPGGIWGSVTVGGTVTIWDEEIAGIKRALKAARDGERLVILTDSRVAIVAIRQAGQKVKAMTADLCQVVAMIAKRECDGGGGTIRLAWVKVHARIFGNERADEMSRLWATRDCPGPLQITEGGLQQVWNAKRQAEWAVEGYSKGRIPGWNRRAIVNDAHTRMGTSNLMV